MIMKKNNINFIYFLTILSYMTSIHAQEKFSDQKVVISTSPFWVPTSVHSTDLDGDDDMDVLCASRGDNKIVWYENDGSGSFSIRQFIANSGDGPESVYASDLDGDGDMDVLSAALYNPNIAWYENLLVSSGIKNNTIKPVNFSLHQNYPNPFNPKTIINYELPTTLIVELSIYNQLGQKVLTLVSERQSAGTHQVELNARNLTSGVYFYHLQAGSFRDVRKMIVMK
jgi:hypothetical protein